MVLRKIPGPLRHPLGIKTLGARDLGVATLPGDLIPQIDDENVGGSQPAFQDIGVDLFHAGVSFAANQGRHDPAASLLRPGTLDLI